MSGAKAPKDLSRQADRARLAYGRLTTDQPRQCIFMGTTNAKLYLKDTTGNRRFWPVEVTIFDIAALTRHRDQLWAEAAHREAAGESIRLDPQLWNAAAVEQQERTVVEPWLDVLSAVLGKLKGKLLAADAWLIVGMEDVGRRTQDHNQRLGSAMKTLGFERTTLSFDGENAKCYARGSKAERQQRIYVVHGQTGWFAAHSAAAATTTATQQTAKDAQNASAARVKARAADDKAAM
jgi:predicted P-loop ATPase